MTDDTHSQQHDILIIGAGVIGLSCALQLLKAGRQVCLIDRSQSSASTASGSCGTITPSHAPPLNSPGIISQALSWMLTPSAPLKIRPTLDIKRIQWFWRFAKRSRSHLYEDSSRARAEILLHSRQLLEDLIEAEALECEFETQGTLYAWRDKEDFQYANKLSEQLKVLGLESIVLNRDELLGKEPALNDSVVGGIHHLRDAQLRPESYLKELKRRVIELGGEIIENCEIKSIHTNSENIISIRNQNEQIYTAEEYVLALGSWSPQLAQQLKLTIPIQPGKGYSLTYHSIEHQIHTPIVLKERSVCVTAWKDGFRLGSTMEFSGFDDSLNPLRLNALRNAGKEYLRDINLDLEQQEWFGWRPMTWDELPIIGRSAFFKNLCLATGHGMLGVSMSVATGEAVRQILCCEKPTLNLYPFRPDRFRDKNYC